MDTVKIAALDIFAYSLPLVRPLKLKGQTVTERTGALVRLTADTGSFGWGEAAPLPGFSRESIGDAVAQLGSLKRRMFGRELPLAIARLDGQFEPWLGTDPRHASVRCGLEMAALNLIARDQAMPMARLLTDRPLETVHLNGLIAEDNNLTETVRRLRRDGCRAIKLKVGRESLERDVERTRDAYHELGSDTTLRLDANRSWTFENAVAFANQISDCEIEYIEEPLAEPKRLAEFTAQTGLPVALDESLVDMTPDQLSSRDFAAAIVLKPTLLGGFDTSAAFARRAKELGMKVVISSAFESSVGIAALAQFAAAYSSFNTPAGLDTLDWFRHDLLNQPIDRAHGRMRIGQLARVSGDLDESMLTEADDD